MPSRLLELGATRLMELGATNLLELGGTRYFMGETPAPQIVSSLYDFVNTFEDPLAATGISDNELTPEALQIVNKIRSVNRRVRYSMGSSIALGDIAGYDDALSLGYQLHGLYLGKNFFKKAIKKVKAIHKTVAKKVINVVKSPAFLAVASIVVNIIPGIGQVASVALAAAATARKLYVQKIDEKKAKKAQAALTAAEQAEFLKQIVDYNQKTQDYFETGKVTIPLNQLLDSNGDPTNDPSKAPGIKYPISIAGTIYNAPAGYVPPPAAAPVATPPAAVVATPPAPVQAVIPPSTAPIIQNVPPPTQQQIIQAAALPAAMALNNGQSAWQANAILHSFPPETQRQIAGEVGDIQKFVNDPSFKPTSIKAIGQFVAMAEFDRGANMGIMTPEQHALADQVKANATPEITKAIEAGRQALLTSAAVDGPDEVKAIEAAIKAGSSSGPSWTTIGFIGLGLVTGGLGLYALSKR